MLKTLFQKIWDSHVVVEQPDAPAVLYIDLHLVHEVTSPQAFTGLRQRGLKVRRPDKTLATMDHSIPTTPVGVPIADAMAAAQIKQMEVNAAEFGITLHGM
jgi:3-isopropylmalate/(R)-2-methylmalate dehydratase large subunit